MYNQNYAGSSHTNLTEYQTVTDIGNDLQKWFNVTLNGNKIGYAMSSYSHSVLGDVFKDYSLLRMPMAGVLREVLLDFYAVVNPDFSIKTFTFGLTSGDYSTDIYGGVKNGFLDIEVQTGGKPTKLVLPASEGLYLPGMVPLLMASKGFPQGRFNLTSFDPFALAVSDMIVEVGAKESVESDGQDYEAYRLDITASGVTSIMWATDNGTVVKEEEAAGMALELTTKRKALNIPDIDPDWDILKSLAVGVDIEIEKPRETSYMKVELVGLEPAGFSLGDHFQIVKSLDPPIVEIIPDLCYGDLAEAKEDDMAKYLESESFVQSDDPRIIRQAGSIIGDISDDSLKVIALADWVYENIEKDYAVSLPSAVEVLRVKRGDCNEHSSLFTALARASGIPTKICLGIVYNEGLFYYHAWPAVYIDDCWWPVDPTIGQHLADATHIKLLQGSFDAQASLMRIVGKLRVRVIDYRTFKNQVEYQ
ncbi:MAG: transglutaminase domain-containing protein [candidate division Zixibacteria bacterium]|nr:transglutaminase domain-containing protein [candidate division Zixibacteria bacterium]